MFKYINKKRQKGQSTLEYAILIIIIIGALLSIQVYIKRGIQGRLRSATDDIGTQFSPGNMEAQVTTSTTGLTRETFQSGASTSTLVEPEDTNVSGTERVLNVNQEYWSSQEDINGGAATTPAP